MKTHLMSPADIKEHIAYVMSLFKLELQNKLETQGHGTKGSSKLIDSMEYDIYKVSTLYVADMLVEDYGIFVEKGVSAESIPFNPGSGKKVSKYIQGLYNFWRRKGLNEANALKASFALANKHKREGMPSRSSFRFSKDGTRLNFVNSVLNNVEDRVQGILLDRFFEDFNNEFIAILDRFSNKII